MQDNVGPERSFDTTGVDTVTEDAASLATTGIRPVYHEPQNDAPTEEIVLDPELILEPVEAAPTSAPRQLDVERPRKSSMPPPLPLDALRAQSTSPKSVRELRDALRSAAERKITRAIPPPLPSRRGATPAPVSGTTAEPTPASDPHPAQLALERLARQMRERDAYLSELESMFAQRSEALVAAEAREASLLARVEQLEAQVRELQLAPAAAPVRDDLRRIRGIGPGFERALHALGVDSFAAIASWTEADVARIGEALDVKAGRIQRDRWVAQARELAGLATDEGPKPADS